MISSTALSYAVYLVILVVMLFVFGIPRIRSKVSLPATFQWTDIPEGTISGTARELFNSTDEMARSLFFTPIRTFTVVGYSIPTEIRLYYNANDATGLLVSIFHAPKNPVTVFEFTTRFVDDSEVDTSNSPLSGVFVKPDWVISEKFPAIRDLSPLYEKHRVRVEARKALGIERRFQELGKLMDEIKRSQERQMQFQAEKGGMKLDPQAGVYRAGNKMALAGIKNFLNPFADDFTTQRFVVGLALSLGVATAATALAKWYDLERLLRGALPGFSDGTIAFLASCPGVILAGLAIGWQFPRKGFLWGFIISVPVVFIMPCLSAEPLFYSLLCAISAHTANRLRALIMK